MNFFYFHIGDYVSKTRHLSWDEDMAYRRLMDAYYMREGPLPADRQQVYRLVQAVTKPQRKAVDAVLREFFTVAEDGHHNSRCDHELAIMKEKQDKARSSANERWRKANGGRGNGGSHSDGNANAHANAPPDAMRTHSEGNATKTKTKTKTNVEELSCPARPRDASAELEAKLREAAGWEREISPKLCITGPIEALIEAGAILETDILPVIRSIADKAENRSTWKFFIPAIVRARDARLAALTAVSPPLTGTANGKSSGNSRSQNRAVVDAIIAEAERRENAGGG